MGAVYSANHESDSIPYQNFCPVTVGYVVRDAWIIINGDNSRITGFVKNLWMGISWGADA